MSEGRQSLRRWLRGPLYGGAANGVRVGSQGERQHLQEALGLPRVSAPKVGDDLGREREARRLAALSNQAFAGATNLAGTLRRDLSPEYLAAAFRDYGHLLEPPTCRQNGYASTKATARHIAASPPWNRQGKQPNVTLRSSTSSICPPRFSMWTTSCGKSSVCMIW